MSTIANPLYLGNHPAVDFLNTAFAPDGVRMEAIPDGQSLLAWAIGAGMIEETAARKLSLRLGAKGMDATAAQARKMRERTRQWLERLQAAPERNYSKVIAALNEQLARGSWRREMVRSGAGLTVVERLQLDTGEALLALIASHIATLAAQEPLALLKQCAGPGCTLLFLDRTKAHRQRFCSAAVCGNRAKVAAYRERQRG